MADSKLDDDWHAYPKVAVSKMTMLTFKEVCKYY